MKPGLARLHEVYRSKGRHLQEDALSLAEALDAAKEGVTEKMEDVGQAQDQVSSGCNGGAASMHA